MIGNITISPGWMGNVEVGVTNVTLSLHFNPMKAMQRAMRPADQDEEDGRPMHGQMQPGMFPQQGYGPPRPPPTVPPRYCRKHNSSEKRVKGEPYQAECQHCKMRLLTSYKDFKY